jgi:CRISPR system Cascade subunit CasA
MSRYNLIDEPWIPLRFPDGTREELGIRDTLLRAQEIAAIEDPSPLVVAALHRFLLAVLYRALMGPTDIDQARQLFREGFPAHKINDYLEKWRDRLWLFDEKYPFGQHPHVAEDEVEPWTKLTAEYNATTNKVLFDHTSTKNPGERTPSECARWLISTMTFSISGGRGYYPSPSPNAILCIPEGNNLHSTLCYCLVPQNREVIHADQPVWEREPAPLPLQNPKREPKGLSDLYTWQPRFIHLCETDEGKVRFIRFIAGEGFEKSSGPVDPMKPYRVDRQQGRLPVKFKERGVWREFDSLLPDQDGLVPMVVDHSLRLAGKRVGALPRNLLILGLKYEPPSANLEFWRMERFSLPEALAGVRSVRSEIHSLLYLAKDVQLALWLSASSYARNLLSRGDPKPNSKTIDSKAVKGFVEPSPRAIKNFVEQMPIHAWYWSTLESRFHEVLREYTLDRDPDEIRCQWLRTVQETLRNAWDMHRTSASAGDAWTIRALVKAEGPVLLKLGELAHEIAKYEPKEVACKN